MVYQILKVRGEKFEGEFSIRESSKRGSRIDTILKDYIAA